MKHLKYCMYGALLAGEKRHPQEVMHELGITYEYAIPQSMADAWWLYNCQYGELPGFITETKCSRNHAKLNKLPDSYINDSKYLDVK